MSVHANESMNFRALQAWQAELIMINKQPLS